MDAPQKLLHAFFPIFLFLAGSSCLFAQTNTRSTIIDGYVTRNGFGVPHLRVEVVGDSLVTQTDSTGFWCLKNVQDNVHVRVKIIEGDSVVHEETFNTQPNFRFKSEKELGINHNLKTVLINPNYQKTPYLSSNHDYISSDYLRSFHTTNLALSLAQLPGINASSMGSGIAKPVIRGQSRNRLVVIDRGIKQEGQQWGADHGLEIDPLSVERITVIRGPEAITYGSDAIGGVLRFDPLPPPHKTKASSVLSYQHNNRNAAASFAVGWKNNKWYGRTRLSGQSYGDLSVPADSFIYNRYRLPLPNQQIKNTAGNDFSLNTDVGRRTKRGYADLALSIYRQEVGIFSGAFGVPRASQLIPDGNTRNVGLPSQRVRHYKLIHRNYKQYSKFQLGIEAGLQHNDRRELAQPHVHGFSYNLNSKESLSLQLTTATLNVKAIHDVAKHMDGIAGFNLEGQINRSGGYEFFLADYNRMSTGVFYLLNYQATKKLRLKAGARADVQQLNIANHQQTQYASDGSVAGSLELVKDMQRFWPVANGSFGADLRVNDSLYFSASIGSSFRFPQAVELAANGIHHGSFRHEIGNPDLLPERGVQLDVSCRKYGKYVDLTLTPYLLYFTNYLYLSPSFRFSPRPEGGQLYLYQQTEARYLGGEATISIRPLKHVHFYTGADYTHAQNFLTRLPMPFTPPPRVFTQLTYNSTEMEKEAKITWSVSAECRYTAAQNRVDRNELATPEALLWNMRASLNYKTKKDRKLSLNFQLLNLFDTRYYNHLSNYRFLNLPEPGRNFVVTIAFE